MSQRTSIFRKLVKEGPIEPAVTTEASTPLVDAVRAMVEHKASSAVVVDADDVLCGILTEQDIVRRVAYRLAETVPVCDAMSSPVLTLKDDDYLYYAIARMRRNGLRHMPVIGPSGDVIGTLGLAKSLAAASMRLMQEIDLLTREDTVQGLEAIKKAQVGLAQHLLDDHVATSEIQGLLTHINNDIYRRVVNLGIASMSEEGWGPAPAGFSVIVMGSGGRGENYLYPDQDNGFIIDDYPDDDHSQIDAWFIELAERMTRDLDTVGLPLCKGFVMATNPLWRKTVSQWKHQLEIWSRRPNTTSLRLCDIFFDFRTVWGPEDRAEDLRRFVTHLACNNPAFLRAMYEDDQDHGTALGWFGRFITIKKDEEPDYEGYLNLKHTATLPLVEAMRLLALRQGITKISTLERMQALHDQNILDDNEYDYLSGAFRHISHLLFRQQLADFKGNKRVTYFIHPDHLTEREKDILVDALKAIDELRKRIRSEMTGDIF